MKTRVVKRNDSSFSRTIREALESNLYIPDWMFEELLTIYTDSIKELSLVYVEEKPVALGMVWEYPDVYDIEGEQIGCYVHPSFRRNGFGRIAVELLGGIEGRQWRVGQEGSGIFWTNLEKVDV